MLTTKFFVLLIIHHSAVNSARILGIFHECSFSHQTLGIKLLSQLASRGHDVTMATPVVPKLNTTNFAVIKLDLEGQGTGDVPILFESHSFSTWDRMVGADEIGLIWTETVLSDKNLQSLLESNRTFDLVIMEQLGNHALKGICYHYKAICVMLSTMGPTWLTNKQMRNPNNPSHMLDMLVNYPPSMNFFQRMHNAYVQYLQELYFYIYTIHKHNEILHKYFPTAPHMGEILHNISLMLVNSHFSTSNPASNLPNVVEIGGFHIDSPKQLPRNLETFLAGADHGAIYFSMGSILKVGNMQKNKINAIVKVLGELPQKVLWVSDLTTHSDLPSNIMMVKWSPQLDVLAHPNVRLFISHGGLLSLTEAVACGVPILGIPVYADQGYNAAFAEACGFGVSLPYVSLNEDNFRNALHEVLYNSTYTKNAKLRSSVFQDQLMKPLDVAMFWIEYVIRHNGAPHLRSAALNLAWYQYLLIDVLLAIVLVFVLIILLIKKLLFVICSKISKKETVEKKKVQ